jgi:light-harvesting complex I chlorophyll a/b binding protein 5
VITQLLMSGWVETKRWYDFKNPGSQGDGSFLGVSDAFKGVENGYPGGAFFDFMGLSRGDAAKYRVRCWALAGAALHWLVQQ